jgi:hypothetical protein
MERRQTKQTLHTSTQIPCSPTSQKAGQLSAIFTLSNLIRDGKKEKEKFALYPNSFHPSIRLIVFFFYPPKPKPICTSLKSLDSSSPILSVRPSVSFV